MVGTDEPPFFGLDVDLRHQHEVALAAVAVDKVAELLADNRLVGPAAELYDAVNLGVVTLDELNGHGESLNECLAIYDVLAEFRPAFLKRGLA